VAAYCQQTHQNKELVMVLDQGADAEKSAIGTYISSLGRDDIRIVEPTGKLSLGALRNLSRESAGGEILCQWDDDDLHHPQRLERQLSALINSGGKALCLEGDAILTREQDALLHELACDRR
jgi:glycosyltransferase involved in cell wall biosynthesis